jgi:hypothetical protein
MKLPQLTLHDLFWLTALTAIVPAAYLCVLGFTYWAYSNEVAPRWPFE